MAKNLPFYKMHASANDFIVIDNRKGAVKNLKAFVKLNCERHTGIGADGVLLIERSKKADFKMRILNADGSEAEMCGNGARCVGLYAREVMKLPAQFKFETLAGIIGAQVKGNVVKVRMSDLKDLRSESFLTVAGEKHPFYFVNTGVPHVVIFRDDLETFPVPEIGEKIRYHEHFKPAGTNVNFVKVTGKKAITVRTYERGVGETQACGTGVTASSIISVLTGKCEAPVRVLTRGGEIINVSLDHDRFHVSNIYLEGKAHFVFSGTCSF